MAKPNIPYAIRVAGRTLRLSTIPLDTHEAGSALSEWKHHRTTQVAEALVRLLERRGERGLLGR